MKVIDLSDHEYDDVENMHSFLDHFNIYVYYSRIIII